MIETTEFTDENSPAGIQVYQLTDAFAWSRLVYPDHPAFLADGRMMLRTSGGPRIADLTDGTLQTLPDQAAWWHLAGDGQHLTYQRTREASDDLVLRRMDLAAGTTEEIFRSSELVPGTTCPVGRIHTQSVSYDGMKLAGLAPTQWGQSESGENAIVVVDGATGDVNVLTTHPEMMSHLRYNPAGGGSLLVQHHHGSRGKDIDVHSIKDDGTGWADLPFGRDDVEASMGHQVWRGSGSEVAAVTYDRGDNSYGWAEGTRPRLISGAPDAPAGHSGRTGRSGMRAEIEPGSGMKGGAQQDFRLCHINPTDDGLRFAFDTFPAYNGTMAGQEIWIGQSTGGMRAPLDSVYVCNSGTVFNSATEGPGCHAHPVVAPDGSVLFQSDYFGFPQAFIVRNLPWR